MNIVLFLLMPLLSIAQKDDSKAMLYKKCYEYIVDDQQLNKNQLIVSDTIIYVERIFFHEVFKKTDESMEDYLSRIDSVDNDKFYSSYYSPLLDSLFHKKNKHVCRKEPFHILYFSRISDNLLFAELVYIKKYVSLSHYICTFLNSTYTYLFILDEDLSIQKVFKIEIFS